MEIKIVISDAGAAAGSSEKSVHIEGPAVSATGTSDATSAGVAGSGGEMAASSAASETTAGTGGSTPAQAPSGAIDAGPAPSGAFYQPGVPQPFNAQRAANVQPPPSSGGTTSSDESAGAAPGSGAGMETSTAEVGQV
jgi:hypothetical protein